MGWFSWLFGEKVEEPPEPLVLGAKLRCPYGSHDSYLYVESGDIEVNNLPKACVEDCKALYNIQTFGDCYAGGLCEGLMDLDETWENPKPQGEKVNGKEIITTKSLLSCKECGAEFKIISSGQDGIFAKQLLFIREMDQKYPGLREILDNPYGSLYLNNGMYETAIQFIEDRMKQNGGEIEAFTLYGKDNLEGEYIKGALGRLMPYCDTRALENFVNGMETAGCKNGMDAATGWKANVINAEMIKMLRKDCKETAEKIETKPFYRWQEENKLLSSAVAEGVTNFTYGMLMYYGATGSAPKNQIKSKQPAAEMMENQGVGTKGAGKTKYPVEKETFLPDEYYQKLDENIAKATAARDAEVSRIQALSKTKQSKVATVVGGVDLRTGDVYVGVKNSGTYAGNATCAEDIVFRGLGGNENANIMMTPAVRPRTSEVIPVCPRCQTKYPINQFQKGTIFDGY
jgi:cytidine deaminase